MQTPTEVKMMESIKSISHLNSNELEALNLVLNAIKSPYKNFVIFELEMQLMFDTNKPTRQSLFAKLQEIILQLADKKARNATLDTKGEFVTDYEALRYKRKYFIAEILDIKEAGIKYFLQELSLKAME